jgi:hypothetical protein
MTRKTVKQPAHVDTRPVNPEDENTKKYKCKFVRFDQPSNVLKTARRKATKTAVYSWEGELMSGGVYELPRFVIEFLNTRVEPIYAQVHKQGGHNNEMITERIGEKPRFSCQMLLG